ncbi:MAG: endonuclease/exonuclease/phosphatase family protein [Candidatus Pacearchaeota archaeon]|jgi:endonuclease/exonuclease/phosphatase family metal-dependent hydrolase
MKLLNLNIYNYNNWQERKPKIIKFIKKEKPDIVTFQEIRDDIQFNNKGDNQAKQLNRALKYPYYAFYQTTDKHKERPEKYDHYCVEGTALLSKFPIIKNEKVKLKKHPKDIYYCGNHYVKIKIDNKIIDVLVVHFSNSDLFSKLHLIETMNQIRKKKIKPIIVGDFNMWHTDWLKKLIGKEYTNSFIFKKYISYPPRKWVLDYIVIPKNYKFKSFKCIGKGLSDHRVLVAEVEVR